jgi:hypothetical protein
MLRNPAFVRPKDIINTTGVPHAPAGELSPNRSFDEVR